MLRLLTHAIARLLPRDLRRCHGAEIAHDIDRRFQEGRRLATFVDVAGAILRERRSESVTYAPLDVPLRRFPVMNSFRQDVSFAVRMLRRRPWFSAAVVLILALGIGSTTAIVSLAQATLLRPVAVNEPERLVEVTRTMSYVGFRSLQASADMADAVFAYANVSGISLNHRGDTRRVPATIVSGNYFDGLGVKAAAGRLLNERDETAGGVPGIVLSHRLWSSAFGRSRDIIGASVEVNRRHAVVVGVAEPGFKGLSLANVGDVWMPAAFTPQLATGFIGRPAALGDDMTWLKVVLRLRPGVTPSQASDRLAVIDPGIKQWLEGTGKGVAVTPVSTAIVLERSRQDLRTFVILLVAVASALLLLGCANVANLLLARGASRRQELAVRAALGAGRGRLMTQLIVESLLLAILGGAAGIFVAAGALKAVGQFRLPGDVPIADLGLGIDATTLASAGLLAGAAALIFGPLPAWLATRRDVRGMLQEGGRGSTRLPFGRILVAAQVALCVTLVGGGLLFARGLQRALSLDLGYNPLNVAMTTADPGLERLAPAAVDQYIAATLSRLRSDPAIVAAGASATRPMRGAIATSIVIEGRPAVDGEDPHVSANLVSEGWIEAMGLRLLAGRTFHETDRKRHTAVISARAARDYWPGRDVLGARFRFDAEASAPAYEVIGIVDDAHYGSVDAEVQPYVYLSIFDAGMPSFRAQLHFFARTSGDPVPAIARIREAAQAADPRVPLSFAMTMEEHVASVLMPQRLGVVLLIVFASAGLLLSAAGVYAVAAYQVSMRTREIGIRMALGAARLRVVRGILRDGAVPVAMGLAAGIALQLWASKFAESFVFGLEAAEPLQIAGAAMIVVAAAVAAVMLPARRAASVDPVVALRN